MIGLEYDIITSDVLEKSSEIRPDKYVEEISLNKAKSVSNKVKDKAIIISADTVIYFNGKIYEKPKTKEEAFNNLKDFSLNMNTAYTGVTIMDLYKNITLSFTTKVDVYFKKITDEMIKFYVQNEKRIFDTCGYVVLGKASLFIDRIDGDYNSLLGLPISTIFENIIKLGYSIDDFNFIKENDIIITSKLLKK